MIPRVNLRDERRGVNAERPGSKSLNVEPRRSLPSRWDLRGEARRFEARTDDLLSAISASVPGQRGCLLSSTSAAADSPTRASISAMMNVEVTLESISHQIRLTLPDGRCGLGHGMVGLIEWSPRGRRLRELRREIDQSGVGSLDWDEIANEVACRRGGWREVS